MAKQQTSITLSLGFTEDLYVEFVPKIKLLFDRSIKRDSKKILDNAINEIVIDGSSVNLVDKAFGDDNPYFCQVTWLVLYDNQKDKDPVRKYEGVPFVLVVKDNKFELKTTSGGNPTLDIVKHSLIGSGSVGLEIGVDFPQSEVFLVPPGAFRFENPIKIKFTPDTNFKIGTLTNLILSRSKVLMPLYIKAKFFEYDEAKNKKVPDSGDDDNYIRDGMDEEYIWLPNHGYKSYWRIGYETSGFAISTLDITGESGSRLAYPEKGGEKTLEIAYTLFASHDGKDYLPIPFSKQMIGYVDFPILQKFTLTKRDALVEELISIDQEIPYTLEINGKVSGFAHDVEIPLTVLLYLKRGNRFEQLTEISVDLKGNKFTAELLDINFSFDSTTQNTFIAALTIDDEVLANPKLGFFDVIHFDPKMFPPYQPSERANIMLERPNYKSAPGVFSNELVVAT